MSQSQSQTTFAYGANNLDGCECPALAAGFHPVHSDLLGMDSVVDRYDTILKDQKGEIDGEVSEEEAKDAWLHALQELSEDKYGEIAAAKTIADYHDWI